MKLSLQDCRIDLDKRTVIRGDQEKRLTGTEADLMRYLCARPNEVLSREELYREVWEHQADLLTRTLDLAVFRLRKKIERDPKNPDHILTVYGRGYSFVPPGGDAQPIPDPVQETKKVTNIGREENPFFGRKEEHRVLTKLMETRSGFITVTGPPGTGKTRLTKHWAAERLSSGTVTSAWFCDLTEAQTEEGVIQAVAAHLGISLNIKEEGTEALACLVGNAINGLGPTIVVVDNAEHVIEWVGPLVAGWWKASPQASFVLTSQVPTGVSMEQRMPLSPLPMPDAEEPDALCASVQLFIDRAQSVKPTFRQTVENQADIKHIVRTLDGLPLAIELAAARIHLMSPATLHTRLADRFRLLKRPKQAGPARHQTLQAALDWSWDLLEPWEQAALVQCSVFHGGFDWEAVEAVVDLSTWPQAPWSVDVVAELVERSLVMVHENQDGLGRLTLLSSVTEYAQARAVEFEHTEAAQAPLRHAHYYAQLGHESYQHSLYSHGGVARRWRIIHDLENLRTGFHKACVAKRGEAAALCGLAAAQVIQILGPVSEGIAMLEKALQQEVPSNIQVRVHIKSGWLLFVAGRNTEAMHQNELALSLSRETGNQQKEGVALGNIADLLMRSGRFPEGLSHYQQALDIARDVGNRLHEGACLGNIGEVYRRQGQMEDALEYYQKALAIHWEMGNRRTEAIVLGNIGEVYRHQGQVDDALRYYQKALVIHREVGNLRFEGFILANLGLLHFREGQYAQAQEFFENSLVILKKVGSRMEVGQILGELGLIALAFEDFTSAERYFRQSIVILDEINPIEACRPHGFLGRVRAEQGQLAEARSHLDQAVAEIGAANKMTQGEVLCNQARVEYLAGDFDAANEALQAAESLAKSLHEGSAFDLQKTISSVKVLNEQ